MRHPTWFYLVISLCALATAGAAINFARDYNRASRFVPLNAAWAYDAHRGDLCTIESKDEDGCAPIRLLTNR